MKNPWNITLNIIQNIVKKSVAKPIVVAIFSLIFVLAPFGTSVALAATPTISVSQQGTTGVYITVNGDPNQSVNLYYYNPGSSVIQTVGTIGSTNVSGVFTTTLYTGSYNIPSGANVFVVVNGQQSSLVTWPATAGGPIQLSQTNISLSLGQSAAVSITGASGNNYYVSSNSNSNVVTTSISGTILSLSGVNTGSSVIQVCSLNGSASCAPLYVTVNSNWYGNTSSQIYVSPSSLTLSPGQSQVVNIQSYTSGSFNQGYYIANNGGSQYFTASISGNSVTVYGNNPGSGTLNICAQFAVSSCTSLYVTVGNYNSWNSGWNTYNPYSYTGSGFTFSNSGTNYAYPNTYSYNYPVTYSYPSTSYTSGSYSSGSTLGRSVSGVFLSQVPSTGISFGLKMTLFTLGLIIWSAFVAFMIARRPTTQAVASASQPLSASSHVQNDTLALFKMHNLKKKGF